MLPSQEELLQRLPENIGLEGLELYTYSSPMGGLEVHVKTIKPLLIDERDLRGTSSFQPVVLQLRAMFENMGMVKSLISNLQTENDELRTQVSELEKYKHHFDLEKEKIQAESSTLSIDGGPLE